MGITYGARAFRFAAILAALVADNAICSAAATNDAAHKAVQPLAVPIIIDGPSRSVTLKPAGRAGRLTFGARADDRLRFAITGVKFSPASAAALVVTVRQPDGSMVPGTSPVHCTSAPQANPRSGCHGELITAQAGPHVIEVDAPFSAGAELTATLSHSATGKLAPSGSHDITLSRPGQDARLQLMLAPDTELSVSGRGGQGPFRMRIFKPDGAMLNEARGDPTVAASLALSGPPGEYVVEIDPANAASGTFTVATQAVAGLSVGGAPLDIKSGTGTNPVRVGFTATAGRNLKVEMTGITFSPDVDGNAALSVTSPSGRLSIRNPNCRTRPLPQTPNVVPACSLVISNAEAGRYHATIEAPPGTTVAGLLRVSETAAGSLVPAMPGRLGGVQ